MTVLLGGGALWILAYVVHLIVWHIRIPRRQAASLLLCFLTVGAAGAAAIFSLVSAGLLVSSPLRLILTMLFYSSASAIYFLLFSAIEADSPTLTMMAIIGRCGRGGISHDRLIEALNEHAFIRPRLDQMLRDQMLIEIDGRLHAGPRGRLLASVILSYRRLLGEPQAGG